jgi:hypothetical protein
VIAALLALAIGGHPALPPARAGQCGWVHGRFLIANGSSVQRIWVIGTDRVVALFDNDDSWPVSMERLEQSGRYSEQRDLIFGDFLVCARERHVPGEMQHVRLKNARNLVVRPG